MYNAGCVSVSMEGGVVKPNKTEFSECFKTIWHTPYIMLLALSAGIGGLLFGYDTGKFLFLLWLFSCSLFS